MSLLSVLTVIFVLAKLFAVAPVAAWSWWLVLSPVLVGMVFSFSMLLLVACIGAIGRN